MNTPQTLLELLSYYQVTRGTLGIAIAEGEDENQTYSHVFMTPLATEMRIANKDTLSLFGKTDAMLSQHYKTRQSHNGNGHRLRFNEDFGTLSTILERQRFFMLKERTCSEGSLIVLTPIVELDYSLIPEEVLKDPKLYVFVQELEDGELAKMKKENLN